MPAEDLAIEDGLIRGKDNRSVSYGELIAGDTIRLELADDVPVKAVDAYTIVGQSVPRVDLPAKATGELVYVHDVRVPGMLHGRVVRPPYAGVDAGPFVGTSLIAVDETSVRDIPGLVAVVQIGDFVGVVAEREENAIRAAAQLKVSWKPTPTLPDLDDIETALRANPSTPRTLIDKGDVDAAIAAAAKPMPRTYVWPYQMHGSIGPSCAVADYQDGAHPGLVRHAKSAHPARRSRAADRTAGSRDRRDPDGSRRLLRPQLRRRRHRRCAAAVARGRPPGPRAADPRTGARLGAEGHRAIDGRQRRAERRRQRRRLRFCHALSVERRADAGAAAHGADCAGSRMCSRWAIAPRSRLTTTTHLRVVAHDMPPIVRASWFRGVSALPNTFAHESYIDELATEAGVDPIEYRLRYLKDPRAVDLVNAVAERAGWTPRPVRQEPEAEGDIVRGRGFAYALYVHSKFPGYGAAWSAWIADVAVNKATGDVSVTRVVAGQDSGLMINPDGVRHQIHGNVIQSTSRALMEEVSFDRRCGDEPANGAPIRSSPFPMCPRSTC